MNILGKETVSIIFLISPTKNPLNDLKRFYKLILL